MNGVITPRTGAHMTQEQLYAAKITQISTTTCKGPWRLVFLLLVLAFHVTGKMLDSTCYASATKLMLTRMRPGQMSIGELLITATDFFLAVIPDIPPSKTRQSNFFEDYREFLIEFCSYCLHCQLISRNTQAYKNIFVFFYSFVINRVGLERL